MDGTVSIPGGGKVKKKYAFVGVLAIAAIGIYVWRRHSATKQIPGIAGGQTDPAGNTGVIDPATGYVQGSPQDQAALAAQGGQGAYGAGYGLATGYGYGAGGPPPIGGGGGNPPGPGSFTTNADWAQYAEQWLTQNEGLAAAATGEAIGKYLGGVPLAPPQVQLVEQAIAFAGLPPVAGPGGHPPGFATTHPRKRKPGPDRTVTADGRQDLAELAAANDVTAAQVVRWNPSLARYNHTGKPLPKGTRVRV